MKKTIDKICLLFVCSCVLFFALACSNEQNKDSIQNAQNTQNTQNTQNVWFYYPLQKTLRSNLVTFRGEVNGENSYEIALMPGGWGMVETLAPENTAISSGSVVVEINMEVFESRLDAANQRIREIEAEMAWHDAKGVIDLEKQKMSHRQTQRALLKTQAEKEWLLKERPFDELFKAEIDLKKAEFSYKTAEEKFKLQKNVAERGFDSPFSLRKAELELEARRGELDFSKRFFVSMKRPPHQEEIAKAIHKIDVASGEAWIASNEYESEKIAFEIEKGNYSFTKEIQVSQSRRYRDLANNPKLYAPADGIVLYPYIYGKQKIAVGANVYGGLVFLKVVATDSYIINALVPETLSSQLVQGLKAKIFFDAYPDKLFSGELFFVGRSSAKIVGRENTAFIFFPVKIKVDPSDYSLTIGMKANIEIEISSEEGFFIPKDLLQKKEGKTVLRYAPAKTKNYQELTVETISYDTDFVKWIDPSVTGGYILY